MMVRGSNSRRARLPPVLLAVAAALLWMAAPVAAQVASPPEHTPGGEVNIQLPSLEQGSFFGLNGHQFLLGGLVVCVARPALRPLDLPRRAQAARAPLHGRDLGADLRDLQGLPGPAGQVPAPARGVHRGRHRRLLLDDRVPVLPHRHRPASSASSAWAAATASPGTASASTPWPTPAPPSPASPASPTPSTPSRCARA